MANKRLTQEQLQKLSLEEAEEHYNLVFGQLAAMAREQNKLYFSGQSKSPYIDAVMECKEREINEIADVLKAKGAKMISFYFKHAEK